MNCFILQDKKYFFSTIFFVKTVHFVVDLKKTNILKTHYLYFICCQMYGLDLFF